MTDHDINPYAAPQSVAPPPDDERQAALRKLRGPSLGLLVLAVSWAGLGTLSTIAMALIWSWHIAQYGWPDGRRLPGGDLALTDLAIVPLFAVNWLIAYGAWAMRRGRHYRLSMVAAIAAIIPTASPWIYLGIPFGIWALVVLRRADVRAAFATRSASRV